MSWHQTDTLNPASHRSAALQPAVRVPDRSAGLQPAFRAREWSAGLQPAFRAGGFTLIELMVVMLIIGILASITVPAMKGMGQANRSAAAHRQVLDDIALARLRAINDRAPVYVVFAPPWVDQAFQITSRTVPEMRQMSNLLSGAYTSYALVSTRRVGDQPGRRTPHYMTEWKSLPEGLLFAPYKFGTIATNLLDEYSRSFMIRTDLPFPTSRSAAKFPLPCIGFNPQGQLISQRDEVVTLAKGSVFTRRDPAGTPIRGQTPDVQLSPDVNRNKPAATQTNNYQFVRINWLTGRAKVELPEFH
jgi:prepilin-type N-terminal cleavage/methylation domain-containing protein